MPRVVEKPKRVRTAGQLANDARLRANAGTLREKRAENNPYILRDMVESEEQDVGQEGTREFTKDNELTPKPVIRTEKKSAKWLEDMAFANEVVTVLVHESTDKFANPFPEVWVNGRVQRFVRGSEIKVRRCYVEKLARLKLTTYDSLKTKDVDGDDVYRYPSHTGLVYPFSLISDSDKGKTWLKNILAEAG